MKPWIPLAVSALLIGPAGAAPAQEVARAARFSVEVEAGPAWQSRNVVEIPNDGSATRFSISDLAGAGPWPAARLYLEWNPDGRHGARLLLAPLSVEADVTPDRPIRFAGALYAAGEPTSVLYTFNSYRLSYRYRFRETARSSAWIGFTAKIRDATVALEQATVSSRKDNVGVVPLLHLAGTWRLGTRWRLLADGDGLAGGPGRAFDLAAKLGYELTPRWTLSGGYRMVEGGADVDEVYSFAWLHYAIVSLRWHPR